MKDSGRVTVAVPVETALAYTADRGWHVLAAPPAWWLQEQERLLAIDPLPAGEHTTSRRRVRLTAEQRRESSRQAAAARWAGHGVDARRAATVPARAVRAEQPPEERRKAAARAARASGAARRRVA